MYDQLTARYTFACPGSREVRVPLSSFRLLERLPGASHPAVYKVSFACPCGEEHAGFVTHDELDWAPLAGSDAVFLNVMTSRLEAAARELLDVAAARIKSGEWPWSFFCYPEGGARPAFPSAFRLLTGEGSKVGLAVECPACSQTTVNLVSREHVDIPFYNDRRVGVVEHIFSRDREQALDAFREELLSSLFDARRRDLAA
jgi:hypothetical protein